MKPAVVYWSGTGNTERACAGGRSLVAFSCAGSSGGTVCCRRGARFTNRFLAGSLYPCQRGAAKRGSTAGSGLSAGSADRTGDRRIDHSQPAYFVRVGCNRFYLSTIEQTQRKRLFHIKTKSAKMN